MKTDIRTISEDSEQYPALLREIDTSPSTLYVRGSTSAWAGRLLLAVVGSRRADHYARAALQHLLPDLIDAGVIVVSGLAYGVDTLAHQLSVEAGQPTVAVLGGGINDTAIYPRTNISLAHRIIEVGGAIVSEYPPDTASYPGHFPARNRIIAGMSQATLVVQAAKRSGSLITARLATEAGRDVCAVPGRIVDSLSAGSNDLLASGAIMICEPADLFTLLGLNIPDLSNEELPDHLTEAQHQVALALSSDPRDIDDIQATCGLSAQEVLAILTELELMDLAYHVGQMRYTGRPKKSAAT